MKISLDGLTFDDVLLLPGYTDVKREEIDISARLTADIKLSIPLVSSPMDTVTTAKLAIALAQVGGIGIIHRNLSIKEQVAQVKTVKSYPLKSVSKQLSPTPPIPPTTDSQGRLRVGAAVGIGPDLDKRTAALVKADVDVIVIDSAHGFNKPIIEATRKLKKAYPNIPIISGNIATKEGAQALIDAGADALRAGMGPGSICITRVISGMGVPQLTAIVEAAKIAKKYHIPIIADGGIRYSGDITKALAAGADTVMIGSLFAGTEEAPGEVMKMKEKKYKYYRGMGSIPAMKEGAAARYGQEIKKGKPLIAEGVEGLIPYKGTVAEFVTQMIGGLRAGMYYVGARSIPDLWQKARFVKVSTAGISESHPHSIIITNAGENY